MKQFSSSNVNKSEPITFQLGKRPGSDEWATYTLAPTKKASVLMALMVGGSKSEFKELDRISQLLDWFSNGLNKDHNKKHDSAVSGCQACDVQARLLDADDDLDFETLMECVSWAMGEVSGAVPTT